MSVAEQTWTRAVELCRAARTVVCVGHVNPDGDALGSMLALGLALERLGASVACSWGSDPLAVPPAYSEILAGQHLIRAPEQLPDRPDLLIACDTASLDRLGTLGPLAGVAKETLVVDHHATNGGFGSLALVDDSAAATAVLAAELIRRLGVPIDAGIAANLYVGLTTDTGSFKFSATTPSVHHLAADLLATGIRHDLISRAIWDTHAFGYVRLLGAALTRAQLEPDAAGGLGLVWTWTDADELDDHGIGMEQIEGVIDEIRVTREAEVALLLKGDTDGTFKVSLRSKGRIDVGAVCVALGGGGHRFAAGFTATGSRDETVAAVREQLAGAPHLPG